MPNGGPTPDCIHCQWLPWMDERPTSFECRLHKLKLKTPVRLFCSDFSAQEDDPTYYMKAETIHEEVAQYDIQLRPKTMYIWLEICAKHEGIKFEPALLASFEEYDAWSEDEFWDVVRDLLHKKREELKRRGHDVV